MSMIIQQKVVIAGYSRASPGQRQTVARFVSLNIDLNQLSSICMWDEDCISE